MRDNLGDRTMNISAALLLALATHVDRSSLAEISKAAPELKKDFNDVSGCVKLVLIVSPG